MEFCQLPSLGNLIHACEAACMVLRYYVNYVYRKFIPLLVLKGKQGESRMPGAGCREKIKRASAPCAFLIYWPIYGLHKDQRWQIF